MTLAPLLHASPAIQLHAFAATGAFMLGAIQLAGPKGTLPHRAIGALWVLLLLLMLVVCVRAFFIPQLRVGGLLAIFMLIVLSFAVWHAHRHRVARHRRTMLGLFVGALVIDGLVTFVPGRIVHAVVFGG